jgi:hypothetical protein
VRLFLSAAIVATIAMAGALVARLGTDGATLVGERFLPLLTAGVVARASLHVLGLSVASGQRRRAAVLRLTAVTAVGSVVIAALLLGPLAPATGPRFPRLVLVLEGLSYLALALFLVLFRGGAPVVPRPQSLAAMVGVVLLLTPLAGGPRWQTFDDGWPPHALRADHAREVESALAAWQATEPILDENLRPYDPSGPYFHYADVWVDEGPGSRFDADGLPMVLANEEYVYNPVTLAQYVLAVHARVLGGKESVEQLRRAADALLAMQGPDGAFRYHYSWHYYLTGETYTPGWVSGMAQGQALSALARAHDLVADPAYLESGRRAIDFLTVPVEGGGTMSDLRYIAPSLADHVFFEEYVSLPYAYTLNGYQFTLLGLYDWSKVDRSDDPSIEHAGELFRAGVTSLRGLLPYYDVGGFSAYDLGHLTFPDRSPHLPARYHGVHVYLLHALHDVTAEPLFAHYERMWRSYVASESDLRSSGR